MDIEDLRTERASNSFLEKKSNELLLKYLKQERKEYDFADTSQWLAFQKKEEDLIYLTTTVVSWIENLPANSPKIKPLNELLNSMFRIGSYIANLETICQTAVSKYSSYEKSFKSASSEFYKSKLMFEKKEFDYKSKIEQLEKEIKFINSK